LLRLLVIAVALVAVLYLLSPLLDGLARASRSRRQKDDGQPPRGRMTRREAYEVLGLTEGASREQILEAHRQLILKVHPDRQGGSTYLAAQINQARDVLLG
jgi:hypothetical protein